MRLRLLTLKIKDFAGIKDESFDFNGKDAKIYGDNATGKTTTAVALNWLLFDKGLQDQKIDIVPKNENNDHIHEKVPTVEASFDYNGNDLTLKRESHPNYEKVEGSTKKHYKNSRTTKQYIDDVPFPITKYKTEIGKMIDEEVFKLVTNPDAFPKLHWQDKRKMLFEIAGDVSDEQVVESSKELEPLMDFIHRHTVDDQMKITNEKLKKAKEDLEHIPVKINTLNDQLPDEDFSGDIDQLEITIDGQEKEIENLNNKKVELQNCGSVIEIKRQISDKQFELDNLKRDLESGTQDKVNGLEREISSLEADMDIYGGQIKRINSEIETLSARKDSLLEEYKEITKERDKVEMQTFNADVEDTCPSCGQSLQEHKVEEAKAHAEKQFNKDKSVKLENYETQLNQTIKSGKDLAAAIESNKEKRNDIDMKVDEVERQLKQKTTQLHKHKGNTVSAENNDQYKTLQKEIEQLESKLRNEREVESEAVNKVAEDIMHEQKVLRDAQGILSDYKSSERIRTSIEELHKEEEALLDTIEDLKHQKYLLDQFTKTKVNLITDKVNQMFELARFKLFHTQVNGDIKETCEVMVNGVTYDGGLNNAMRINAGIDITNTLSKYYGIELFMFVDNSEAVTELKESESQQIQLIVSEPDKKLRMETE